MFADVILRNDLTKASFNYDVSELSPRSHSMVVVECSGCHSLLKREFRYINKRHSCPTVIGDQKHCYKCDQWKSLSLFNKNGKLKGGVAKLCRECYNSHNAVKKYEASRKARLRNASMDGDYKFYINRRGTRMISKWRLNKIPYDISTDFLIELWEKQHGLCYYTNIPMVGVGTFKGLSVWNSPSLDRLTPNIGYIRTNVVWCINSVNSFKGELTEEEFKNVVKTVNWWVFK